MRTGREREMATLEKALQIAAKAHAREWLAANHDRVPALHVGFYKVGSGEPTVTYSEAVDEALQPAGIRL